MNWQPIETAPKDKMRILTWGYTPAVYGYSKREYKFSISSWGDKDWNSQATSSFGPRFVPTHWMPIPEPPQGE